MEHAIKKNITIIKNIAWPQWIAGFGVNLLVIQMGILFGWSSPYISYLTSPESHMPITLTEASWIVSLVSIGRPLGAVLGSTAVHYMGSKTTILITSVLLALCWLLTICANQVEWLYAARTLGGIGLGMMYTCFSLYLAEIADPNIRGALVFLATSGVTIGSLIICIMGAYVSIMISSIVNFVLAILLIVIFIWLPESPQHFVKNKQEDKARSSILWYRRGCNVELELQTLKKFNETNKSLPLKEALKEFKQPYIRKAMSLVMMLYIFAMICGGSNVNFYAESILRTGKVTIIDPSVVVIIANALASVSCLLGTLLIIKFSGKILLIISYLGVMVSLICLGAEFQLLDMGYDAARLQDFLIFGMLFFEISLFFAMSSMPSMVLSEIFPPHIKCIAVCFGSIWAGTFSFISARTYQPLIDLITEKYVFYVYAIFALTAVPYTLLYLPDTTGKSLQQIQEELMKKT